MLGEIFKAYVALINTAGVVRERYSPLSVDLGIVFAVLIQGQVLSGPAGAHAVAVYRHVAAVHVQHVLSVSRRTLSTQHVRARRVAGAPALVALAFPGRPTAAVAMPAVHPLCGRTAKTVHPPRLTAVLAARVSALAPFVRHPTVVGSRRDGRFAGRRLGLAGPARRRRRSREGSARRTVRRDPPPGRRAFASTAHHPPGLRARAARHRTRGPLRRRLPPVWAGDALDRGTRHRRPARLRGRRSVEPIALSSRQQCSVTVLALNLPVLVSLATRCVALFKQEKTNKRMRGGFMWRE